MKINLNGGGFLHANSTTLWKKPNNIEWVKDNSSDISFYLDYLIFKGIKNKTSKYKFAWWNESPEIVNIKEDILCYYDEIINNYDLIFTYDQELINKNPDKFKFIYPVGYWIENPFLHNKNKLVSMITSNKQITPLQQQRLEIALKYKEKIDLFGRGFNEISKKEEGLNDYMFSICVENGIHDSYFSEKILDCFATGTIPIYVGTKEISNFFNPDGIIFLDENFDINLLTEELYKSKTKYVKENFEKVLKYDLPEDYIYEKYLKEYENN